MIVNQFFYWNYFWANYEKSKKHSAYLASHFLLGLSLEEILEINFKKIKEPS